MAGWEPYPQEKWTVAQEQAYAEGRKSGLSDRSGQSSRSKSGGKRKRYVRTAAGQRRYGQPIGTEIGNPRNREAAKAQRDTKATKSYQQLVGADRKAQSNAMRKLSNDQLQRLSRVAYSFRSADPNVVRLRIGVAGELARRGFNVNDFGGLGPRTPGRAASPRTSARRAPVRKPAPRKKSIKPARSAMSARKNDRRLRELSMPQMRKAVRVFSRVPADKRQAVARVLVRRAIELGAPHLLGESVIEAANLTDERRTQIIELAGKWKHGWIPLDGVALESKMKGRTGGKQWWSGGKGGAKGRLHAGVGVPKKGGTRRAVTSEALVRKGGPAVPGSRRVHGAGGSRRDLPNNKDTGGRYAARSRSDYSKRSTESLRKELGPQHGPDHPLRKEIKRRDRLNAQRHQRGGAYRAGPGEFERGSRGARFRTELEGRKAARAQANLPASAKARQRDNARRALEQMDRPESRRSRIEHDVFGPGKNVRNASPEELRKARTKLKNQIKKYHQPGNLTERSLPLASRDRFDRYDVLQSIEAKLGVPENRRFKPPQAIGSGRPTEAQYLARSRLMRSQRRKGGSKSAATAEPKRKPGVKGNASTMRRSVEAGRAARERKAGSGRTSVVKSGSNREGGPKMNTSALDREIAELEAQKGKSTADWKHLENLKARRAGANNEGTTRMGGSKAAGPGGFTPTIRSRKPVDELSPNELRMEATRAEIKDRREPGKGWDRLAASLREREKAKADDATVARKTAPRNGAPKLGPGEGTAGKKVAGAPAGFQAYQVDGTLYDTVLTDSDGKVVGYAKKRSGSSAVGRSGEATYVKNTGYSVYDASGTRIGMANTRKSALDRIARMRDAGKA